MLQLPLSLAEHPYWTRHENKRPLIKNGDFNNAKSFNAVQSYSSIGVLLSPDTPLAIIDVDFNGNKAEKQAFQELAIDCGFTTPEDWALENYKLWLNQHQQLHPKLQQLINTTYTELSPSGTGLHIYVHLTDKHRTSVAYKKSAAFQGQISIQNQFMTVTGIPLYGSPNTIQEVSLTDFPECFVFTKTQTQAQATSDTDALNLPITAITKAQVANALSIVPPIPLKRTQELWQQFANRAYEHYDFWITIGMALHDWGSTTNQETIAYMLWSDWSQKDVESYKGEEDIEAHWRSFGNSNNAVTIATLLALAARLQFSYPRPLITKDGKIPSCPLINEYDNFEYLMKYYNIELWEDDMYYVSGDTEIMDKYFRTPKTQPLLDKFYGPFNQKELMSFCLRLCQSSNWRKMSSAALLVQTWCTVATQPLDIFGEWLDRPFDEQPSHMHKVQVLNQEYNVTQFNNQSTPEYLFSCLNVRASSDKERELYFACFKKTLMLLIKFREPQFQNNAFADNGGMLILVGPENTYKSTFLRLLLPEALYGARKEVNMQLGGEKSTRDFLRQMGRKAIIQIDEFEGFMDMSGKSSQIKNLLSGNEVTFTDIYENSERKVLRKAIIVGTTNETRLAMSDNGTRRLWIIPVGKIDTIGATKVNLHLLYNNLRNEFRAKCLHGEQPWLLTQSEIDLLGAHNQNMSASSELSIILEELWPADGAQMPNEYLDKVDVRRYKGPKLMTSLEIMAYINFKSIRIKSSLPALERALERHCGRWTNSLQNDIVRKGTSIIRKGKLCQNPRATGGFNYHRWIMPPIAKESPEE